MASGALSRDPTFKCFSPLNAASGNGIPQGTMKKNDLIMMAREILGAQSHQNEEKLRG
jgi:hypothetical protein